MRVHKLERNKELKAKIIYRNIILQSNALVQARKDFDLYGMRIFLLGLSTLHPKCTNFSERYDQEFKECFIPTSYITKIWNRRKSGRSLTAELEKSCKKLFNAVIELPQKEGGGKITPIFKRLEYYKRHGLYLQFEESMLPYILDFTNNKGYTKMLFSQMFYLRSTYSIRLIELLLQYRNTPKFKKSKIIVRRISIEDLKFMLNVPAGTYRGRTSDLTKMVIQSSIDEINSHTRYKMSYLYVKNKIKIIAWEFSLDISGVNYENLTVSLNNPAIKSLRDFGFSISAAQAILKKCNDTQDCLKRIEMAKTKLNELQSQQKSINSQGVLRNIILQQSSSPENFDQNSMCFNIPSKDILKDEKKSAVELKEKTVTIISKMLTEKSNESFIQKLLKKFNLTIEEFKEKYQKK